MSTKPSPYQALPFSDRCRQVWGLGDHLLIGVSPGNSYFSARRIAELIDWGREFFDAVDVVYADLHVDAQFEAFGHTPEHAGRRAAKEIKTTARRIERGVEQAGPARVGVHALSEFLVEPVYQRLRAEVEAALREDQVFREAAEGMARSFLAGRLPAGVAAEAGQLAAGLRYICAELPFFLDTPALLGRASSISCHHIELPLTPVLFGRCEGLRAAPAQGYAVVRPAQAAGVAEAPGVAEASETLAA
ncbi:tRNA-dependent cyclodipeptide synthase [Kitasatospora sp. NBC_01287]|uniref:tRNA-dependent cyclodipeptide synthase n=1 Tax=Kitasatospora sp. NBC_01287 TaxID=2903573 RepID=UPI0022569D66|nr:tRNA-dependent cyclodipeptide synthase [Kitasatospora sp. NBC_01287]MCX4745379.1 tRNA-dependent cyclodipeptide synthase [Kitasatospora sp. NBC_01287]